MEAGYWQRKKKPGHGNRDPGFAKQLLSVLQDLVFNRRHIREAHIIIIFLRILVEEPGPDTKWLDVPANLSFHQVSSAEAMGEQSSSPTTEIFNQDPVFWAGIAVHLGGIHQRRASESWVTSVISKRGGAFAVKVGILPPLGLAG